MILSLACVLFHLWPPINSIVEHSCPLGTLFDTNSVLAISTLWNIETRISNKIPCQQGPLHSEKTSFWQVLRLPNCDRLLNFASTLPGTVQWLQPSSSAPCQSPPPHANSRVPTRSNIITASRSSLGSTRHSSNRKTRHHQSSNSPSKDARPTTQTSRCIEEPNEPECQCWFYAYDPVTYKACQFCCSRDRKFYDYRRVGLHEATLHESKANDPKHHLEDHRRWRDFETMNITDKQWREASTAGRGEDIREKWIKTYMILFKVGLDEVPEPGKFQ